MTDSDSSIVEQLQKAIHAAITDLFPEVIFELADIPVVHPKELHRGDYTTTVSLNLGKQLKKNPMEIAESLKKALSKQLAVGSFEKVEVVAPGFINFWLSHDFLITQMGSINDSQKIPDKNGKKIIIEFSSPNIAKPFTIGHLRSTIIGAALANMYEFLGWTVFRDNHLGDWGTQFGKQIYAIKQWGNESDIANSERPVKQLVDLYVKFHTEAEKNPALEDEGRLWFKKLEDGDSEARNLWQKCIDWSWKEFAAIYNRLGVTFSENDGRGYGESYFEDKMDSVIDELKRKKIARVDNNALLVFFADEKFPPLMIQKSDGATLYATRDLATDAFRKKHYGADIVIVNEVGAEQALYFRQLFETEYMLGWYRPGQRVHVKHGLYRFKDTKMSTRKGNVVWLDMVLQEAFDRVKMLVGERLSESVVWDVAIGAIKWQDLRRETTGDIVFDYDTMLALEGNSGPYVQYTFARCQSILRKSEQNFQFSIRNFQSNFKLNNEELVILRLLYRFPEVVASAAQTYSPHLVCDFLFDLAQAFNGFYHKHTILPIEFRLHLTSAVGQTIKSGLHLLGIKSPEKM